MEDLAALTPSLVMALAFVAVVVAVYRYARRSGASEDAALDRAEAGEPVAPAPVEPAEPAEPARPSLAAPRNIWSVPVDPDERPPAADPEPPAPPAHPR